LEVDGVLRASKGGSLTPEAIEGISSCQVIVSDVRSGRDVSGESQVCNVACDETGFRSPGDLDSNFSVCEDKSVDGAVGSLSETTSSSGGRGPLDTDSPAGEVIVVSFIAVISSGAGIKEVGKVSSEETNQGDGSVISSGVNFNPGVKVSG